MKTLAAIEAAIWILLLKAKYIISSKRFNKECLINFLIEAYYKGSKPKFQWLAVETNICNFKKGIKEAYVGSLNLNMNKSYFANLNNYIIQIQNLSGN